jgi:predicted amidophosphoribosyltransferase
MAARPSLWAVVRGELAELVLPQRCVACGGFGAALHAACVEALPRADGERCMRCWEPLRRGAGGAASGGNTCARCRRTPPLIVARRAAFRFEGAARLAVLEAKYRGVSALLPALARAAALAVDPTWAVEAVAWVPLHPRRRRARGFDQGEAIARGVAAALDLPVRGDLIRRVRFTPPQAALGRAARARNVAGAFAPREGGPVPARVLLVDDVMTTGATLEAAAGALRPAGVTRVFGLTLAIEDADGT